MVTAAQTFILIEKNASFQNGIKASVVFLFLNSRNTDILQHELNYRVCFDNLRNGPMPIPLKS